MSVVSIEKHPKRKNQLCAKLNGEIIPLVNYIEIKSTPGNMTKVFIELIVAKTIKDEVIIKEISNEA